MLVVSADLNERAMIKWGHEIFGEGNHKEKKSKDDKIQRKVRSWNVDNYQAVRRQLLDWGVIAQICYPNEGDKQDPTIFFDTEYFFPANPVTLYNHEIPEEEKKTKLSKSFLEIIKNFEEGVYNTRFKFNCPLFRNHNLLAFFNSRWVIYLLLQYVNENSEILMLLSGLQFIDPEHGSYYEKILRKKAKIYALFDKRSPDQIKRASLLVQKYKGRLFVKYNRIRLYGTSRRIVLNNVFAIDVIKILQHEELNSEITLQNKSKVNFEEIFTKDMEFGSKKFYQLDENTNEKVGDHDIFYSGIIYTDSNVLLFQKSFESWGELGITLEKMMKENKLVVEKRSQW